MPKKQSLDNGSRKHDGERKPSDVSSTASGAVSRKNPKPYRHRRHENSERPDSQQQHKPVSRTQSNSEPPPSEPIAESIAQSEPNVAEESPPPIPNIPTETSTTNSSVDNSTASVVTTPTNPTEPTDNADNGAEEAKAKKKKSNKKKKVGNPIGFTNFETFQNSSSVNASANNSFGVLAEIKD
jgi:hypothetical protein